MDIVDKRKRIEKINEEMGHKRLEFGTNVMLKTLTTDFERKYGEKRKYTRKRDVAVSFCVDTGDFYTRKNMHGRHRQITKAKETTKYKVLGSNVTYGDAVDYIEKMASRRVIDAIEMMAMIEILRVAFSLKTFDIRCQDDRCLEYLEDIIKRNKRKK